METEELLRRIADQATRVVHGVRPEQLDRPTPCAGWDVRALLAHMLGPARPVAADAPALQRLLAYAGRTV